jgi:hypothetical protein
MELRLKSTWIGSNRLEKIGMTPEESARKTAAINYEIIITHGLNGGVGFEWQGLFIHDPFTDPQYGAFPVDPVQQYGEAYTGSIFATDPASALQTAQRQLREKASADLKGYCVEHGLNAAAVIETACAVRADEAGKGFEALTDEQVQTVWAHVDDAATACGADSRY